MSCFMIAVSRVIYLLLNNAGILFEKYLLRNTNIKPFVCI